KAPRARARTPIINKRVRFIVLHQDKQKHSSTPEPGENRPFLCAGKLTESNWLRWRKHCSRWSRSAGWCLQRSQGSRPASPRIPRYPVPLRRAKILSNAASFLLPPRETSSLLQPGYPSRGKDIARGIRIRFRCGSSEANLSRPRIPPHNTLQNARKCNLLRTLSNHGATWHWSLWTWVRRDGACRDSLTLNGFRRSGQDHRHGVFVGNGPAWNASQSHGEGGAGRNQDGTDPPALEGLAPGAF